MAEFWDIPDLKNEYRQLTQNLTELDIGVAYGSDVRRVVLPPEFQDYLQQRNDPELDSVMKDIEINQVVLDYAKDDIDNREEILANLDNATEGEFEDHIQEFHRDNLTSRYLPGRDAPFLIKDREGVENRVAEEMKQTLGLSE